MRSRFDPPETALRVGECRRSVGWQLAAGSRQQILRTTGRRTGCAALGVLLLAWLLATPGAVGPSTQPPAPIATPAYRVIDIASGRTLASSREDLLRTPVLPGSILKIATLVAALESGVIRPETRMLCPRQIEIEGRRYSCSHPDVGRPIGPAEALAHSCNGYFASIATRLRREALDLALTQLGLPPSSPSVPMAAAALGLEGTRMSAEQLLAAFVRITTEAPARMRNDTRAVVLEGLRGAAEYGTASVFGNRGLSALAKTGTAPMPGGGYEGLVVAVTPAVRPTRGIVLMAPGAAGFDAARLAADTLAALPPVSAAAGPRPRGETPTVPAGRGRRVIRVGTARRDDGYDIVTVPLEEYVARVVSAEASPSGGVEARKALAIVVRTFALRNQGRHGRDGFDLCDLTHCQVMGARTRGGDEAAQATVGQSLFAAGQLADVFYTASCGGHSERPSSVWPGAADPPHLAARAEPECRADSSWQNEIPAADLQRALMLSGRRGQVLRNLAVLARSGSGRVTRLRIDGFEPQEIDGEDFRLAVGRSLGWQVLKSTLFDVERTAAGYRFRGSGRGHGVGLCVVGSARLAARGQSAMAILGAYFPGTEIRAADESGAVLVPRARVDIVVPAGEERERARVEGISAATLREFSGKTGVSIPARVTLVFHATVESYTRASGQPWWTAGATRGALIDFIPLSTLRQRGLLEVTLRHELAHVVTGDRVKGQSIWLREAVAMELAGDPRSAEMRRDGSTREGPLPCPTDAEWRAIRSPDELQKAYRRAAACYAAR